MTGLRRAAASATFVLAVVACALGATSLARAQGQGTSSTGAPSDGAGGSEGAPARGTPVEREPTDLVEDARVIPRGPTIPDLQHPSPEISLEQTIVSVAPKTGGVGAGSPAHDGALTSHLFEADFEIPLVPRKLFVGGEYAFAAARAPAQRDVRFVSGQPEIFARIVHGGPDDEWAVGGGLGIVPPLVTYDDLDDSERTRTVTASALVGIVRPWDLALFFDRRATARPWIDLRIGRHAFVAQVRQGLDVAMRTSGPSSTGGGGAFSGSVGDVELVSITALYLGWQPIPELALGVEAWDVYLLKTDLPISDRDRTVFAISPGVRFFHRWVEPGVSLLLPIGAPLLGAVDDYVALRIDMRVWLDG